MAEARVSAVSASSFYKSDAYGPENLIGGNKEFGGWITDVGHCDNAWVSFRFAEPAVLAAVEICNGFIEEEAARTRDDYYYHKRAKAITLSFGQDGPAPVEFILEDIKRPQVFALHADKPAREARLTIRSTYDTAPNDATKPFDVLGLRHVAWLRH